MTKLCFLAHCRSPSVPSTASAHYRPRLPPSPTYPSPDVHLATEAHHLPVYFRPISPYAVPGPRQSTVLTPFSVRRPPARPASPGNGPRVTDTSESKSPGASIYRLLPHFSRCYIYSAHLWRPVGQESRRPAIILARCGL